MSNYYEKPQTGKKYSNLKSEMQEGDGLTYLCSLTEEPLTWYEHLLSWCLHHKTLLLLLLLLLEVIVFILVTIWWQQHQTIQIVNLGGQSYPVTATSLYPKHSILSHRTAAELLP